MKTLSDEPIVEFRRIDGSREAYRCSLVAVRFEDADTVKGGRVVFTGKAQTPDRTEVQWRQVYEDIKADIE